MNTRTKKWIVASSIGAIGLGTAAGAGVYFFTKTQPEQWNDSATTLRNLRVGFDGIDVISYMDRGMDPIMVEQTPGSNDANPTYAPLTKAQYDKMDNNYKSHIQHFNRVYYNVTEAVEDISKEITWLNTRTKDSKTFTATNKDLVHNQLITTPTGIKGDKIILQTKVSYKKWDSISQRINHYNDFKVETKEFAVEVILWDRKDKETHVKGDGYDVMATMSFPSFKFLKAIEYNPSIIQKTKKSFQSGNNIGKNEVKFAPFWANNGSKLIWDSSNYTFSNVKVDNKKLALKMSNVRFLTAKDISAVGYKVITPAKDFGKLGRLDNQFEIQKDGINSNPNVAKRGPELKLTVWW